MRRPSSFSSILVGVVLAVGLHPYSDPSIVGRWLKAFMSDSSVGLALRSSDRATPLVVLGFAVLLGVGATRLVVAACPASGLASPARWPRSSWPTAPRSSKEAPSPRTSQRPEKIPSYYAEAARYLDAQGDATRVLIEPGQNFAAYDWGTLFDTIWPGHHDPTRDPPRADDPGLVPDNRSSPGLRPHAPAGHLRALDAGTDRPPVQCRRRRPAVEPRLLALQHASPAGDLGAVRPAARRGSASRSSFGKAVPNSRPGAVQPHRRGGSGRARPNAPWPPPIAVFPVSDPRPIYRAEPAAAPLVIDGSGAGVVAAAAAGLLADNPTIFYAGDASTATPKLLRRGRHPAAELVVTDSNRKVLERWSSVSDNIGETLPAVPEPSDRGPDRGRVCRSSPMSRPTEQSLAVYSGGPLRVGLRLRQPGQPSRRRTGRPKPSTATSQTAWSVAAFSNATGNWLQVRLDHPVTTDHLNLVQVLGSTVNRWITRVTLRFDGEPSRHRRISASASRTSAGQTIRFPSPELHDACGSRSTLRRGPGGSRSLGASGSRLLRGPDSRREHRGDDPDAFGPVAGARGLLALSPPHHGDDPGPCLAPPRPARIPSSP